MMRTTCNKNRNDKRGNADPWSRMALIGLLFVSGVGARVDDGVPGPWDGELFTVQRDPVAFARDVTTTFATTPPAPSLFTQADAVAYELLRHTKSMEEVDAMRTAQALWDEGETLGLDPFLFLAVIHIESFYNHRAISPVGAEGLMQLMPHTAELMAREENIRWHMGDSFDPVVNVRLGARYLARLARRFRRLDVALTAYNRGPGATSYILRHHGDLPPAVAAFYAEKVLQRYKHLRQVYGGLPRDV